MTTIKTLETTDVRIFRIYFGHPKDTYNTEYELNCLEKIKELYPGCDIVNPRDISIEDLDKNPRGYVDFMKQMDKYYFPAIDSCDLVIVAKTKNGKISPGVQKEIPYAESKNIPIKYLDIPFPENNRPTLICQQCKKQFVPEENTDYDVVDGQTLCWYCITGDEE